MRTPRLVDPIPVCISLGRLSDPFREPSAPPGRLRSSRMPSSAHNHISHPSHTQHWVTTSFIGQAIPSPRPPRFHRTIVSLQSSPCCLLSSAVATLIFVRAHWASFSSASGPLGPVPLLPAIPGRYPALTSPKPGRYPAYGSIPILLPCPKPSCT